LVLKKVLSKDKTFFKMLHYSDLRLLTGFMSAAFIDITSSEGFVYLGNYLLVVKGSCDIEGVTLAKDWMVVGKTVEPSPYKVAASQGSSCLAMGVSF